MPVGMKRRDGMTALRLAFAAMLLSVALAGAAADCRVVDSELQGTYTGPCVNGLAHGQVTAAGTARYTGEFVEGRKQGAGHKEWPNGDRYEGEFLNDLKHGHGIYVWGKNSIWAGQRYTGRFVNDQRHGSGVYAWPDGRQLAGRWQHDRPLMALPPAMQRTARAHTERMVVFSQPGARVCRNIPVGIAQVDVVSGTVLKLEADQLHIRIDRIGRFNNILDDREIRAGLEIVQDPEHWFPCR